MTNQIVKMLCSKCLVIYGPQRQKADGWLLDKSTQITPDSGTYTRAHTHTYTRTHIYCNLLVCV